MKRKHNFLGNKKTWPKVLVVACLLGLFLLMLLALLFPSIANGQSINLTPAQADQIQSKLQSQLQGVQFANHTMYMGLWVIHIYSFQYTTGTYTFDMYVYFFWTDPNITTANWYLTNGYPINSAAKILVVSNDTSNIKYEIYRVTATLNTPPDAKNYPFDQITMNVSLELINPGYTVNLAWLKNATGVDPEFNNPTWKTTNIQLSTSEHAYPLGTEAPTAVMSITQERVKQSSAIASMFPPIIFCIVSAISFLFGLKDPGSVGLRMGLNTSMLITTILFSLSLSSAIPPSSSISIFGLFMVSVLVFLSMNLVVTIVGFAHFVKFKDANFTLKINRWGFVISIILPVLLFVVLFALRA